MTRVRLAMSSISRWLAAEAARLPGTLILALGVALLALIATFDQLAGPHAPLSLFYVLPVALVTWLVGSRWGLLFAVFGGVAAFAYGFPSLPRHLSPVEIGWAAAARVAGFGVVALLIAELRSARDAQRALANTDETTSIPNARAFRAAALREIARSARSREPLTAVYIDCDNFKLVNDTLGHGAGDDVLRSVAATIAASLRITDHVSRLGGDEFGIILPGLADADARALVPKLRQRLLVEMHARRWPVTFSIGVRTFADPPADIDQLLHEIDRLQYLAKESGKDRIAFGDTPNPPASRRVAA